MSMSKFATGNVKPIVRYREVAAGLVRVGYTATVVALNHPSPLIRSGDMVDTSTVVSYDPTTGRFETQNSIYELERS